MSQDAILKTNQFDQIVNEATSGAIIGENFQALKDALHLAMAGAQPQGQAEASSMSAHQFKYEKELHFHAPGHAGRAPLVLRADTEADLQRLENDILYGHD